VRCRRRCFLGVAVFARGGEIVFGNFAGYVPPGAVVGGSVVAIVANLPKEDRGGMA